MIEIHKQVLEITDIQLLMLKTTDVILKIGEQKGKISVWYRNDLNIQLMPQRRTFYIVGTGHDMSHCHKQGIMFVDTVIMSNGLVWHVYAEER